MYGGTPQYEPNKVLLMLHFRFTQKEVARQLGVSQQAIAKCVAKLRAEGHRIPKSRSKFYRLNTHTVKILTRMGMSPSEIAKRFGVTTPTVYYHLHKIRDEQATNEHRASRDEGSNNA